MAYAIALAWLSMSARRTRLLKHFESQPSAWAFGSGLKYTEYQHHSSHGPLASISRRPPTPVPTHCTHRCESTRPLSCELYRGRAVWRRVSSTRARPGSTGRPSPFCRASELARSWPRGGGRRNPRASFLQRASSVQRTSFLQRASSLQKSSFLQRVSSLLKSQRGPSGQTQSQEAPGSK